MATPPSQRRVRVLIYELVGPHQAEYHSLPEFKQAIDLMARALPQFVDVMVEDAKQHDARRRAALEQARLMPPRPHLVRDTDPEKENNPDA